RRRPESGATTPLTLQVFGLLCCSFKLTNTYPIKRASLAWPSRATQMTRSEHVDATWAKRSFSFSNGNCVEVAELPGGSVGVRDSREPAGSVLRFTREEWDAFLGGARRGEFDRFGRTAARRATSTSALARSPASGPVEIREK